VLAFIKYVSYLRNSTAPPHAGAPGAALVPGRAPLTDAALLRAGCGEDHIHTTADLQRRCDELGLVLPTPAGAVLAALPSAAAEDERSVSPYSGATSALDVSALQRRASLSTAAGGWSAIDGGSPEPGPLIGTAPEHSVAAGVEAAVPLTAAHFEGWFSDAAAAADDDEGAARLADVPPPPPLREVNVTLPPAGRDDYGMDSEYTDDATSAVSASPPPPSLYARLAAASPTRAPRVVDVVGRRVLRPRDNMFRLPATGAAAATHPVMRDAREHAAQHSSQLYGLDGRGSECGSAANTAGGRQPHRLRSPSFGSAASSLSGLHHSRRQDGPSVSVSGEDGPDAPQHSRAERAASPPAVLGRLASGHLLLPGARLVILNRRLDALAVAQQRQDAKRRAKTRRS
jgi:hypothetical protein